MSMTPVPARPVDELQRVTRKVFCKRYAACLNLALSRGWQNFSCSACADFDPAERPALDWIEDALQCADLLNIVFGIMPETGWWGG